ncbi:hypothetical protein [Bradyrhizobium sp. BR 1433]|uniref:hypothetical protein n=1 Tax=Bradyrhizobium sp. BR 1433 TaxID=3447967 RepID=UPI003EE75466
MGDRRNHFTAAASAVGYLYQARLALLLCIPHLNNGAEVEVSIERLDDISFEKDGTPFELLQTKHHIDRVASLGNASPDLWKTLRTWAEAAKDDPSLPRARSWSWLPPPLPPPDRRPLCFGHLWPTRLG